MNDLHALRNYAVKAVINQKRLISDVAQEIGVSKRRVFNWVSANKGGKSKKHSASVVSAAEVKAMREALSILETEVTQLKSELNQYHITETLSNGKIQLSLQKRIDLQKAS